MILIGSRALAIRAPQLLNRNPKDFDFICRESEAFDFLKSFDLSFKKEANKIIAEDSDSPCEFELIENRPSNQLFESLVKNDSKTLSTSFGLIPNVDLLFTLKASHKYLKNSPYFWKTVRDYHVLKNAGASILPEYQEFFKLRERETYSYPHPKLNVDKNTFFSHDQIDYVYDHDSIHEAVKCLDKPAYSYYMKDGAEVKSDKKKFFDSSTEIQLCGVAEECAVLALERSLIPYPGKLSPEQAIRFALSKVCSSITSGWFREYAYENIFSVLDFIKGYKYWEKFQNGLTTGVVKPFQGAKENGY